MPRLGSLPYTTQVELRVQFHPVPGVVSDLEQCVANELVVLVQPEPAIYWKVQNKVPGLRFEVEQVRMDLLYAELHDRADARGLRAPPPRGPRERPLAYARIAHPPRAAHPPTALHARAHALAAQCVRP